MKKKKRFKLQFLSNDIGIDLGTSSIIMNVDGKGLKVREPSILALDRNTGKVLQVGSSARNMLGRTPGNIVAMQPIQNGVIHDQEMTVKLLEALFRKVSKNSFLAPKPRVVISVPSDISEIEERSVINSAIEAGARRVFLIEAPLAAALGAKLNIEENRGYMVVDIGGGTTDVAVVTGNSIAVSASTHVAGDVFDSAIIHHLRAKHGLIIGRVTAEEIKIQIGCLYPRNVDLSTIVRGRDANTGVPKETTVTSSEIYDVLKKRAPKIIEQIINVLENTSSELVGDIATNGITLTGGCSQLYGMAEYITEQTGITCTLADDPASCVAYGCGVSLAWINTMKEGPANIARKRLLKQK